MIVDTEFGQISIPREHCLWCFAENRYMRCTNCEWKKQLRECGMKYVKIKMREYDESTESV